MALTTRPFRSVLYIPGSKERALEKAKTLPVDAIIFDLEDAVAVEEKANARELLARTLRDTDYGPRSKIVRVNGLGTAWGSEDLAALASCPIDAILLPKVGSTSDLDIAGTLGPNAALWAMMESPVGILNAAQIAAHSRLQGMVMGTNDLAKDLRSQGRASMTMALQHCLLAARANGRVIVDGVYNAFKDEDGLRAECEEGRALGFDGKTLIHPAQIAVTNEVFAPSEAEIDLARRQIAAFEEAEAQGQGVAVVDGAIVENLHVATARATLAQADAIAELERHS